MDEGGCGGQQPAQFELFRQFGVLPGASDTHVAEFFPGFVTPASDFGREWGVHHYGLRGHRQDKETDDREVTELLDADEISAFPSGELVADLIEGLWPTTTAPCR